MWIREIPSELFWPGFWVNVITLPLAIMVTLVGIAITRWFRANDQEHKGTQDQIALLNLVNTELERNLRHMQGVKSQGGIGPLIADSGAWDAVRAEFVVLAKPSSPRVADLLQAITTAHAWCASTVGLMDLNLQNVVTGRQDPERLRDWLVSNLDNTENALESAIGRVTEYRNALAA